MGSARRLRIGAAMAVLVGAAVIGLTPTAASACSFMPPTLGFNGYAPSGEGLRGGGLVAGGTIGIVGIGWYTTDGQVASDCGGDYDFVPRPPVTIVVHFDTLSGPRSIAVVAEVSSARIPREEADDATPDQFHIGVRLPIPADATAVTARAGSVTAEAEIDGAVATTVPTSPAPAPPAGAATPVSGDPSFTG